MSWSFFFSLKRNCNDKSNHLFLLQKWVEMKYFSDYFLIYNSILLNKIGVFIIETDGKMPSGRFHGSIYFLSNRDLYFLSFRNNGCRVIMENAYINGYCFQIDNSVFVCMLFNGFHHLNTLCLLLIAVKSKPYSSFDLASLGLGDCGTVGLRTGSCSQNSLALRASFISPPICSDSPSTFSDTM